MNQYMKNLAMTPVGHELMYKVLNAIQKIKETPQGKEFAEPLKYIDLGLSDYLQVVKRPMDFKTISVNIQNHEYRYLYELLHDIALIFKNAFMYNQDDVDFQYTIQSVEQEVKDALQRIDHRITSEIYQIIGHADVSQFISNEDASPITLGRFQLTLIKLRKLPERLASQCIYELCAEKGEVDSIHNTFRILKPCNYTPDQLRFFEKRVSEVYKQHLMDKKRARKLSASK